MSAPYPRDPLPTVELSNVEMTTRDGVVLRANITRPDLPGRFPVILSRTAYAKDGADFNRHCHFYAQYGYVTVMQNSRGRFDSEGVYEPIFQEGRDGYDAVEWAARLPWSNGRVGMSGQSYLAMTQYAMLANEALPPSLQTMAPLSASSDPHASWVYHTGGASMWGWMVAYAIWKGRNTLDRAGRSDLLTRLDAYVVDDPEAFAPPLRQEWFEHLPLSDWADLLADAAPYLRDYLSNDADGEYWHRADVARHAHKATVPMMHVSSWYDIFAEGAPRAFSSIRARSASPAARAAQRLIIGPWHHASFADPSPVVGEMDFGPQARLDMHGRQVRWFDHWLKDIDSGLLGEPPVLVFTMGSKTWEHFEQWPPARARIEPWFLHSGGTANGLSGDGSLSAAAPAQEPPDCYLYEPSDPVPTLGGNNLSIPMGVMDQRPAEKRTDVLVYTSDPLTDSLRVTGNIVVELWASSSAVDTDYTAKLVDVHPDGYAQNLVDGIIRARYRDSASTATLMRPNEPYLFRIELGGTSNVFLPGHRIRLDISSSNFPRFDRNLNTGEPFGQGTHPKTARQTVFHEPQRPSRVLLPVLG